MKNPEREPARKNPDGVYSQSSLRDGLKKDGIKASAEKRRLNPSQVERKIQDWIEVVGRRTGWPKAHYSQVMGGYIWPIIFRKAKLVVDLDRSRYLLPVPRAGLSESVRSREECAFRRGYKRISILDTDVWNLGVARALQAIEEFFEQGGFKSSENSIEIIKDNLYQRKVKRMELRRRALAAKTRPRRMRARAAQVPE